MQKLNIIPEKINKTSMSTKSIINKCYNDNLWFFLPYFVFLLLGAIFLAFIRKGDDILAMNQYNNIVLDEFFRYITYVGDGIFLTFLLIPMLIIRLRYFVYFLFSFLTSGGMAQLLKHYFELPRPCAFFNDSILLHYVPGVKIYMAHSFPSGHSATAFAMFLMLSIISKNNYTKLFFFLFAITVGLSRIYLLQHFFIDVYFGSIVGTIFSLSNYVLINKYWQRANNNWQDRGIVHYYGYLRNKK